MLLPTRTDLAPRDRKRWRMPKGGACAAGWDQVVAHLHESDRTSKYRITSEPLHYQNLSGLKPTLEQRLIGEYAVAVCAARAGRFGSAQQEEIGHLWPCVSIFDT